MSAAGLYLHVPFCRRRCFYCHFVHESWDRERYRRYLDALAGEAALRGRGRRVDSVFFGGGSPSLLGEADLARVDAILRARFRIAAGSEVTLEANPEDVSRARLDAWRRLGVNRLSLGVQSFAAADLRWLGRRHGVRGAERAVDLAAAAGFDNLSLDFIIGLPSQSRQSVAAGLTAAARLGAVHVSVYLMEGVRRSERRDPALYHHARSVLAGLGFRHYEVSNFARPGRESRHNLKYWTSQPYIGLGPSAAGFDGRRDRQNLEKLDDWCAAIERGRLPERARHAWAPALRRLVTGLRLLDGVPRRAAAPYPDALASLMEDGLLREQGGRVAVVPERILLLNEALTRFMP